MINLHTKFELSFYVYALRVYGRQRKNVEIRVVWGGVKVTGNVVHYAIECIQRPIQL